MLNDNTIAPLYYKLEIRISRSNGWHYKYKYDQYLVKNEILWKW